MSKTHARFSPSKLENLENCPKFEYASSDVLASEGTMLHEATEKRNLAGLDAEQKTAVESCLAYVDVLAAKMPGGIILQEERVELADLSYGHLDWAVIFPNKEADVVDFKFGRGEVSSAQKNLQIRTYAAALMEMRPELEKVRGHIVQPRVGTPNWAEFDRSVVAEVRARIELVYQRSGDPFSAPTTGDHCEKCQWAHKCPALKPGLVSLAETFSMPVPDVLLGKLEPTPEDRAKLHVLATLLEKVAEQWKKNNSEAFFEKGIQIPGLVVRERSSGPKVPSGNMVAALGKLRDAGYASEDQLIGCLSLSIPELCRQMTEIRGSTEREERAQVLELLDGLTVESVSRYLAKAPKGKK